MANRTVLKIFYYYFLISFFLYGLGASIGFPILLIALIKLKLNAGLIMLYMLGYVLFSVLILFIDYLFYKLIGIIIEHEDKLSPLVEEVDDTEPEHIVLCKRCGYQLFDDDAICPNCGLKRGKKNEKDKKD